MNRFLLVLIVFFSLPAAAAVGDCTTFSPVIPREVWDYKISLDRCDDLTGVGITCDEFIATVVAASQVWNETTNGPIFEYTGTTTNSDTTCSNNTVTVGTVDAGGAPAKTTFKCTIPPFVVPSLFIVRVFRDSGANTIPWEEGIAASNQLDLMSALVHEFGHVLGMDHPNADVPADDAGASMRPTIGLGSGFSNWTFGDTQGRSPYHYDLKCAANTQGTRELVPITRQVASSGVLSNQLPFAASVQNKASGGIGLCQITGGSNPRFCGHVQTDDFSAHSPTVTSNPDPGLVTGLSEPDDVEFGFTPFLFRELGTSSLVFASFVNDNDFPTDFDVDSPHNLYKSSTFNTFSTSTTWEHCSVASSNCPSEVRVNSGHPLAIGFHTSTQQTVAVWSDQTRDDSSDDREIMISVGLSLSNASGVATLQQPDATGVRTSSPPAIACDQISFCVLAYTSPTSTTHRISTRQVSIAFNSSLGRHQATVGSAGTATGMDTNSRIALWCPAVSKCFLAAKLLRADEPIGLWSTTDGTTWQLEDDTYTVSVIGPHAPSGWELAPTRLLTHSN